MNPLIDIHLHVTRQVTDEEYPSSEKTENVTCLGDKIKEYVHEIGYSNANLMTIFMEIMMKGKVIVDFQHYTERLELIRREEQEVVALETLGGIINQFITDLKSSSRQLASSKITQSIVVQARHFRHKTSVIQTKSFQERLRQLKK